MTDIFRMFCYVLMGGALFTLIAIEVIRLVDVYRRRKRAEQAWKREVARIERIRQSYSMEVQNHD